MNWIENLYRTYENCRAKVGDFTEEEVLLPLSHTTQNAHIEVTLDGQGNFRRARVLPKSEQSTVIPCTEASGGRSGAKPTSHPLCDKLQYLAGDFLDFGGIVTSGFKAKPSEPHNIYMKLLGDWCQSPYANPKVQAVFQYVKKGTVINDLASVSILPLKNGERVMLDEWTDKEQAAPVIFDVLPATSTPQDAFIRWAVELTGELESRLWRDREVWCSWSKFYESTLSSNGLCYVLGTNENLAVQHPAKLRHAADKAKLISSNDSSGFTFRGRFTDPEGAQVCGVSFDVTQKAHNALRWLIARQKGCLGDQAIVAWAVSGKDVPRLVEATDKLVEDEDNVTIAPPNEAPSSLSHANVGEALALRLQKKIRGYRARLGGTDKIVVLVLDSATTGRMSISYYRELAGSEFLDRIEQWHNECAWHQNFGEGRRFIGAPAPEQIARLVYGKKFKMQDSLEVDDKVTASISRRILPCIIDAEPIPSNIVLSAVRRASARQSMNQSDWKSLIGVACALYRKQNIHEKYSMDYEETRNTRDYLYGCLLAVADHIEERALWLEVKKTEKSERRVRDTNAAKLMQRFSLNPYQTWPVIRLRLEPYLSRLKNNRPGLHQRLTFYLDDFHNRLSSNFVDPSPLKGEFLLGFHSFRKRLWDEAKARKKKLHEKKGEDLPPQIEHLN